LLIIGLIAGFLSIINKPKPRSMNLIAEALLSYYMLFAIGINNLVNFIFHVFFGEMAASFIGWADSPFQAEVGFASLGIGIVGLMAFRAGLPFRVATYIPPAVFSLGAQGAYHQMIAAHNFSRQCGPILLTDIILPAVCFYCYTFPINTRRPIGELKWYIPSRGELT
jgi:hypothetical protein